MRDPGSSVKLSYFLTVVSSPIFMDDVTWKNWKKLTKNTWVA